MGRERPVVNIRKLRTTCQARAEPAKRAAALPSAAESAGQRPFTIGGAVPLRHAGAGGR